MPRYLESNAYLQLIEQAPNLKEQAEEFERSIIKQKIPVSFILHKPYMSGFFISHLCKLKNGDGRKWLKYLRTWHSLHAKKKKLLSGEDQSFLHCSRHA